MILLETICEIHTIPFVRNLFHFQNTCENQVFRSRDMQPFVLLFFLVVIRFAIIF
jgi:C4-type Zn-finger protein